MSAARILIIGGYGTFGGRLVQLLADETRLTLIVAGRSREKADAFCASATLLILPVSPISREEASRGCRAWS